MSFLTITIATIGRNTLQCAIDSVLSQTIPCELVVEPDPNKTGHGATLNRALEKVQTPWVGNLDDDDHLHPQYVEMLALELKEDPMADMVVFRMQRMVDNKPKAMPPFTITRPEQLEFGNVGISFALKTELAKKYHYLTKDHPDGYCPDWQMVRAIRENGHKIVVSPCVAYFVEPPYYFNTDEDTGTIQTLS